MTDPEIRVRINDNGRTRLQIGPFAGPKGVLWVDLPLSEVEPFIERLRDALKKARETDSGASST